MADEPLAVSTELAGAIQVVHVAGRVDSTTSGTFDARMDEVATGDGAQVVLDLAQVTYISSAGLRSLLTLSKRVKTLGGGLVLAAVPPRVQDVFDIAGFTGIFAIAPTAAEALTRLSPSP
jgi:anti-sigma B factor antagonist